MTPANAILIQTVWAVFLVLLFSAWEPDAAAMPAPNVSADSNINLTTSLLPSSAEHSKHLKSAFDNLTDSVICAGLIFYGMAVAAVYVLRRTQPLADRPYRTWGYPFTPAMLLLAYAGAFVSMLMQQWTQAMGVLSLIAAGVAYYYVAKALRRRMDR